MKTVWMGLFLLTSACSVVRVEHDDHAGSLDGASGGGDQAEPLEPSPESLRAPRTCDVGAPLIVRETFKAADWPQAWLPVDAGHSWVEDGAGQLLADPAKSHGRALYRSFGDIDVAVRWVPSAQQVFRIALRGDVENKPSTIVEGHGVGVPRPQWIRARIWDELGTTRLEVHEWFDGEDEPEGWLRSVLESAGPLGTFSLLAVEQSGSTQPVRIEEVLICQLVVGSDA